MLQRFLQRVLMVILGIMVGCLALLFIVAVLLKGAIQKLFVRFSPKKTAVVATMALVLLSGATANAGEVAKLEGNSLVYYQTTKVIPNVPNGITAEQARQLVDGAVPSVKLSAEKTRFYFGFPLTKIKTDTTVLFRNGWATEGESHESLSANYIVLASILILYGFFVAYLDELVMAFAVAVGFLIIAAVAVFLVDTEMLKAVGSSTVLLSVGGFYGLYLRRKKEKNRGASLEHASCFYG